MNSFAKLCRRKTVFLLSVALIAGHVAPAFAQQRTPGAQASPASSDKKFDLTIDNIMRGPGLVGYEQTGVRWSADSQRLYFQWKSYSEARDKDPDTYTVNRDGTGLRQLTEEEAKNAPPANGEQSRDKKLTVFVENGDVFVYDHAAGRRRQITATTDAESNAHLTRDGKRVYFTRGGNLFVMALDAGSLAQMTDIRPAVQAAQSSQIGTGDQFAGRQQTAAAPQRGTESQEVLKKEERELLDIVKRRAEKREADEARRKKEERLKPFNLAPRQTVASLQVSPDEKYVIASIIEASEPARQATGEQARAASDRDVQLQQPLWSEDGTKAVLMARAADNKDRWILALDPATGKTRVIVSEHDDAWIDGPGAFTLGWLGDNQHIYFQSERDGYAHLYTVAFDGGEAKPLTSGKWEVTGVQLSEDKSKFYLTTSEVHPGERHLYAMNVNGGERLKLTSQPGNNQAFISPDEKTLALAYSYSNKPPEVYLQENRAGASAVKITNSPAPEFWSYHWI